MRDWHAESLDTVIEDLRTDTQSGLSEREAKLRLEKGQNVLPAPESDGFARMLARQFVSPLIYVLFAASGIVFVLGNHADGIIILAVLVFNAVIGAAQEGKAQNTLLALQKFTETKTSVIRDGVERIVPDTEIVPGDLVALYEGAKVPADIRISEARTLRVNEASLTGESVPVHKSNDPVVAGAPLAERRNMVFKGTAITSGFGKGVVVATGRETEIGKISSAVARISTEIPLAADIRQLSRIIVLVVLVISGFLFTFGIARGMPARDIFATVVALAVSIIPEGLPLVLTLILATGVWRMAKRNALVKKLQAVEALGQANVIAVDKTGTLTMNELVVRAVFTNGKLFSVEGVGYEPRGYVKFGGDVVRPEEHSGLMHTAKVAALTANAHVALQEADGIWQVSGDPTEAAMLIFAEKLGLKRDVLEHDLPPTGDLPFDYATKCHVSSHGSGNSRLVTVAGAPEKVLLRASHILRNGKLEELTKRGHDELDATFRDLSRKGLRVVALGYVEGRDGPGVELPDNLIFAGFLGMEDSLRPEVPDAMARAQEAEIRVVMMTGDYKATAIAIANQAGIWHPKSEVLTDDDFAKLTPGELDEIIPRVSVFARITPEHKMKIIEAYRRQGLVVAMTGDGVNDAPSLVAADLGVAMGKIGTEVAREASDIVLLDDNFGTIVTAIEEGRNMYATIQKAILYLLSTSFGELLSIVMAMAAGLPVPVLPAQILWLNLVTDPFMGSALAVEPKEPGLLKHRAKKRALITGNMLLRTLFMGIAMMAGTLVVFNHYLGMQPAKAYTMSLTVLAIFQWFNAWNCRSERRSIFASNPLQNGYLLLATLLSAGLHAMVVYLPAFHGILHTVPLELGDWGIAAAVSLSIIAIDELRKGIIGIVERYPRTFHNL